MYNFGQGNTCDWNTGRFLEKWQLKANQAIHQNSKASQKNIEEVIFHFYLHYNSDSALTSSQITTHQNR